MRRAKTVLKELEAEPVSAFPKYEPRHDEGQISFMDVTSSEVVEILKETDINTITPIEAMNILYKLKKKVQDD